MMNYKELIENFIPLDNREATDKKMFLELINLLNDDILKRSTSFAHITSSAIVLNEDLDKVLMVYHNIYDSWSWIGGHADGCGSLYKVALKELEEETGVTNVTPIKKDIISIEVLPVKSHTKNGEIVSPHLHLNTTFAFIAQEKEPLRVKEDENSGVIWIKISELKNKVKEKDMIPIYEKIIERAIINKVI